MNIAHNWGETELPESGEINDEVVTVFTRGHCHSFALAMHQETGWPMFGLGKGFENDSPAHCVVYCPQLDDYIDIQGPGVRERWPSMFEQRVELLEPNQIGCLKYYRKPEVDAARPFVKTVLENLPKEPVHNNSEMLPKIVLTL